MLSCDDVVAAGGRDRRARKRSRGQRVRLKVDRLTCEPRPGVERHDPKSCSADGQQALGRPAENLPFVRSRDPIAQRIARGRLRFRCDQNTIPSSRLTDQAPDLGFVSLHVRYTRRAAKLLVGS